MRREAGLLKRVRGTPLAPGTYLAAVIGSTLAAPNSFRNLSTSSSVRSFSWMAGTAAKKARAMCQGSGPVLSPSKIGPGDVKSRAKAPGGAAMRPPKGGSAFCAAGRSALRSTGTRASAARSTTRGGGWVASSPRTGSAGSGSAQRRLSLSRRTGW